MTVEVFMQSPAFSEPILSRNILKTYENRKTSRHTYFIPSSCVTSCKVLQKPGAHISLISSKYLYLNPSEQLCGTSTKNFYRFNYHILVSSLGAHPPPPRRSGSCRASAVRTPSSKLSSQISKFPTPSKLSHITRTPL